MNVVVVQIREVAPVTWSPDGQQIAFYAYRSGSRQVWVQPVAGGPARQLTQGETESAWPLWSPDGQRISLIQGRTGEWKAWVVPASGGEPTQLIMHNTSVGTHRWSPDGKRLVFQSSRSNAEEEWWLVLANGGMPELLLELAYAPRWSPDGKWIVYLGLGREGKNVWAVAVDGRAKRQLTDLVGRRGGPVSSDRALATDGSYVYFAWQEDIGDIWVANVTYPGLWD